MTHLARLDGVGDGPAERLQLLGCILRHDAKSLRELCVRDAVAFQLCVLEGGEGFGLVFSLKKPRLRFPASR